MKITFLGALQILFVALKLTGVITWGWFYVMLPLIIPASLSLIGLAILSFVAVGIVKKTGLSFWNALKLAKGVNLE